MTEKKEGPEYVSIGFNMAAGMIFFAAIGHVLSEKTGTTAWTLAGIFLGLFYIAYEVWKMVRKWNG